jgi:tetratricopeptide (TPR) repeat protein
MGDLQPELQQFPIPPPVNQPSVLPADAGRKDAAAQPLQAVAQSPKIAEELPKQTGFTKIGDLQPELQQLPITPPVNQPSSVLPADTGPKDMAAQPLQAAAQSPEIAEELPKQTASTSRRRRILRAFYRTAAVLLSIVVIAAATYIALGTEGRNPVQNAWNLFLTNAHLRTNAPVLQNRSGPAGIPATATGLHKAQEALPRNSDAILLKIKEAQTLAAENRFAESRVLLNQILEINPNDQSALAALKEVEAKSGAANQGAADGQPAQELFSRISALIDTGKLQSAKTELDKLQRGYPADPEVLKLRRRWQAKNTKDIQEKARIEEEQQKAARRQKEDEWNRQVADLLTRGKYNEANGAWHLWITENPGSSRAQEFGAKIEEVQRGLREYAAALSENRYQDAINALRSVEKTNPGDPSLAELRRQVDVRKAAARAALTVHRLGARAVLLLDGQPIGNDGEVENEIIPIGNHTLAIENEGVTVASRSQEYSEGQRVALVYDMAKLNLRPMSEADRELLAHRKELEGVHRFETEHQHGILRGNCRGVLSIDFLDIAYKPSSGLHGFRMPLKLFKLRFEGRLVDLSNISDNKHFQTFRFPDQQTADRFIRVWGELKAMAR